MDYEKKYKEAIGLMKDCIPDADGLVHVRTQEIRQGAKVSAIEGFETEFERQVSGLIASAINKEHEYNQGYVKWTANALLNYAKHELEKQGEFKLKDKHYERMEHCIGIEQDKVKDGLYKAFRNGSCYNECIPEWEDLVRNGYAKRWGEIGHTIFYGLTRKGFEAIARRWGVRIRYEIEVG